MSEDKRIKKEAALWLATLQSGNVDPATEAEFLRWQANDERHAQSVTQLYERISALQTSQLSNLHADHIAAALTTPSRRGFLRGALIVSGTAIGGWLLAHAGSTGIAMPGDLYTSIGERRRFTLNDGSTLKLNASSRVSTGYRTLHLRQGEMLLDISPSTNTDFTVLTDFCSITSASNTFLIRQRGDGCYALAIDGTLNIAGFNGERFTLLPRQWMSITRAGLASQGRAQGGETSWVYGVLTVENLPLKEVVERLRPYHYGLIHLDPAVSQLSVSGTFPIDDVRHSLEMLTAAFPIKTIERTPAWISVVPS
ncbi:FecR domain-containing protein [Pseudomonas asplenii]|uniref:FecR domain-containing protein n=1 Tax=Pseudomonas asplenii TaxID=53407 RepID=UPI0037CA7B87